MKTLAWQQFFIEQRDLHGKVVFSVAELANVAQSTPHALNVELARLRARGMIARYAQGRYGLTKGVGPEHVVSAVDPGAYLSGFYALRRHNLVTQVPAEITCFTNRRHNRTSGRAAPGWRLRFIRVPPSIYAKPPAGVIAPAEQALCDFVYLNLRAGLDPRHLVTFMNLDRLSRPRLRKALRRYPEGVSRSVERLLGAEPRFAPRQG